MTNTDVDAKCIVAIDFGTSGIALAYSEINDEKAEPTTMLIEWNSRYAVKNENNVLLTNDGKFIRFGEDALQSYLVHDSSSDDSSDYSSDYSSSDDEYIIDEVKTNFQNHQLELLFYGYCMHTEREFRCVIPHEIMKLIYSYNAPYIAQISKKLAKKAMLFESIKTSLYDGDISETIHCIDGRMCSTSTVFVAIFKHIKHHIFYFFRTHGIAINYISEIQWILTVPAIWSDLAKHKMEKWTLHAGLIKRDHSNHLKFVYESDCTLISRQYDVNQILNGERCIVIDAGAGVVDIGCYEIDGKHAQEIHIPTGGLWGCNIVDAQFEKLLSEIFFDSKEFTSFKVNYSSKYMALINNFRKAKTTFCRQAKFHAVSLPFDFIMEMVDYVSTLNGSDEQDEFETFIANSRPFGLAKGNLRMEEDELFISCEIWKQMFDEAIHLIIDHIESLIKTINEREDDENNKGKKVKYLHMSGGFICSKYFQHRINQVFGSDSTYDLQISTAMKPDLAVIDGAMKLGRTPNYINARRLKYTYGIAVDRLQEKVDMSRLPKGYLDKHKVHRNVYIHPTIRKPVVRSLFSMIARKNSLIERDQCIEKKYRRFHKMQKEVSISLYCSDVVDQYVVGDDKPLVVVIATFPEDYNEQQFKIRFYFGDTMIYARMVLMHGDTDQEILTDALQLKYE